MLTELHYSLAFPHLRHRFHRRLACGLLEKGPRLAQANDWARGTIRILQSLQDRRNAMADVARKMVERPGVNVDQLVELLAKNAAAELTTIY